MSCCGYGAGPVAGYGPGGYGPGGYGPVGGYGGGFSLIVVLFILLIIVGCGCFLGYGAR